MAHHDRGLRGRSGISLSASTGRVAGDNWKKLWLSANNKDVQVVNTCSRWWKSYDVSDILRQKDLTAVSCFAPSAPRAARIGLAVCTER
eukprot:scaffold2879_cov269-Prasinococcus_capsulatus_cf.AAC.3